MKITNRPDLLKMGHSSCLIWERRNGDFQITICSGSINCSDRSEFFQVEISYKNVFLFQNCIFKNVEDYYSRVINFKNTNTCSSENFFGFVQLMQEFAVRYSENPLSFFSKIADTFYDVGHRDGKQLIQSQMKELLDIEK